MNKGLEIIGMLKKTSQRFHQYREKNDLLKTFITHCYLNQKVFAHPKGILDSIQIRLNHGIPANVVFIRHRKYKMEWLAILSTDTSLSNEEVI